MSAPTRYEVWCFPTERNATSKPRRVAGPFESRDDAREALYFDEQDEPSPDKHDYFSWRVVEVSAVE